MEFAPAKKQRACPSSEIWVRPAERRTFAFGTAIRAMAIILMTSNIVTGSEPSSGVPGIGMRELIGTDSGCGLNSEMTSMSLSRSSLVSPRPRIPPQQIDMPASWALRMVLSLSS